MRTNKKVVRLTEGQLHNIIYKSINEVLNEGFFDNARTMWQGAKNARKLQASVNDFKKNGNSQSLIANKICDQIESFAQSNELDEMDLAKWIVGEILRRFRVSQVGYKYDNGVKQADFKGLDGSYH